MINLLDLYSKHIIVLPISNKTITLRPILTKEEQLLLAAKDDKKNLLDANIQVLQSCTQTENINWLNESFCDFCFAFIELRKISIGNDVLFTVYCQNETENNGDKTEICGAATKVKFEIDKIITIKNIENKNLSPVKIVDNKFSVTMKPQTVEWFKNFYFKDIKDSERYFELVREHIISINGESESNSNLTDDEKREFLNSLRPSEYRKLLKWMLNIPHLIITVKWTCSKCNKENIAEEVDILNFFELY